MQIKYFGKRSTNFLTLTQLSALTTLGSDILYARQLLEAGEVVAVPTETVYGLAANAYDKAAVSKLFHIKQRPSFDPLIVHAGSFEQIQDFVHAPPAPAWALARHFWPGPLTLLLEKKALIPDLVTSGLPRVAVRIPQHGMTLQLLRQLPFPLAAPSANPFGYISPTTPQHVQAQLGHQIPYILAGGPCTVGLESTIVGFEAGQAVIYRLGGTSVEVIEQVIGPVRVASTVGSPPSAPGALKSHYAPSKPFFLGAMPDLLARYTQQQVGLLAFDQHYPEVAPHHQVLLSTTSSLEEAAQNLFAALRTLDALPVDCILGTPVPNQGLGQAINDRLQRAASRWVMD
ncbi:MAG: L-threonylcarbamoyladenylate synthase [Roseivirga sp.]